MRLALALAPLLLACHTGDDADADDPVDSEPAVDSEPPSDSVPPEDSEPAAETDDTEMVDDGDADDDGIPDEVEGRAEGVDSDGDGVPDWRDPDADGDGVPDRAEGTADPDGDGLGAWRDEDADGDCRPDAAEWDGATPPGDRDGDGRPDGLDRDSDGDGLADGVEDADCDGVLDAGETDARSADSDGDGATDVVELALGTGARDPADHPAARGLLFAVAPFGGPAAADVEVGFEPRQDRADVYVLVDRSGSMATELVAVRTNLAAALSSLRCAPQGSGDPATCLHDLWAGAGTVGYAGTGGEPYRNHVDVQPAPSFSALPTTEPGGCCSEPMTFALHTAVTGQGTAGVPDCGIATVATRTTCAGSPAALAAHDAWGHPCFREGAVPVVVLVTDEPPLTTGGTFSVQTCPDFATVVAPELTARGVRVVGITGSDADAQVTADLAEIATATGAVDARNGGAPLVFDGSGTGAPEAIRLALETLFDGYPLEVGPILLADPSGADVRSDFVDRVEARLHGSGACTGGFALRDADDDGHDDTFLGVLPRTPVCFAIVPAANTTVPATSEPQAFRVVLEASDEGVHPLGRQTVWFVVPPEAVE